MPTMPKLNKHRRPPRINKQELADKLAHLKSVLRRHKRGGILIRPEGAMRWLTGLRHQIIDLAPGDPSPVQGLVLLKGATFEITFVTTRIEMPRVREQIPPIFKGVRGVKVKYAQELPKVGKTVLLPGPKLYDTVLGEIVRPLLGGRRGNQYKKLDWVSNMASALLAATAHQIKPGMNGAEVRGLLFKNFADHLVESNLFLVALAGQETQFHPLYDDRYKVKPKKWLKLVAGARYSDMIVSETVMVNIGGKITSKLADSYAALQEGVVEYADLYRNGAVERDIYDEIGKRYAKIGRKYGLKNFRKAAYFHHMGGPTSPLGNRDYILEAGSRNTCFPGMQFAINPVEPYYCTKVETQGIVAEKGAPEVIDMSKYTPEKLMSYREITASGSTVGKINNLILR